MSENGAAVTEAAFDAAEAARHHAASFLYTDVDVREIYYLPAGAGPRDVRLLVVGGLVAREATPLEVLDFGVDIGQPSAHMMHVVDITPEQWDRLRAGRLVLPPGWSLEGSVRYPDAGP